MSTQLTTSQLEKAKHMYFSDIPVVDISEELSIPINELGLKIFGYDKTGRDPKCWYQERKDANPKSFVTYKHVKPYILSIAEAKLSDMIVEGVDLLKENGGIEEIDDLDTAVSIVSKLDKLGRLEKGEATEHIAVDHGFTLRDIQNGVRMVDNENENEETLDGEAKIKRTREAIEEGASGPPLPRTEQG